MNIQEFETRTGLSVGDEQYAKIEQIYLNAGNMDKDAFCKAWKPAKPATLELIEELSHNVDGKRIHIDRLDIKIQNLEHDLEMEREIKNRHANELEALKKVDEELKREQARAIADKVNLTLALLKAGMDEEAIDIVGHAYVVSLKCSAKMELSDADRAFIAFTLGERK